MRSIILAPAMLLVAAQLAPLGIAATAVAADQSKPNIVLIIADDTGWGDLSCHRGFEEQEDRKRLSKMYATPHIDSLAEDGIDLHQYTQAAPTCSPSRSGIMTGRSPARFGIVSQLEYPLNEKIRQPDWLNPLFGDAQGMTLPKALLAAGYDTAIVGKWHLVEEKEGNQTDAPTPSAYGFSSWQLMRGPWKPVMQPVESFDKAVEYLGKQSAAKPFFLELTMHETHVLYTPSTAAEKWAKDKGFNEREVPYASSLYDQDQGVGKVITKLEEMKLTDNTLVIFTSDNGPAKWYDNKDAVAGQYNNRGLKGGLRGDKGDLYEGGIRVPFIAKWPNRIPKGVKDKANVVNGVDLLPTLAAAAGITLTGQEGRDGENRLDVLTKNRVDETEVTKVDVPRTTKTALYWRVENQFAIREGDYKLVTDQYLNKPGLFNLVNDRAESNNLAATELVKLKELKDKLRAWKDSLPSQVDPDAVSKARLAPTVASPVPRQVATVGQPFTLDLSRHFTDPLDHPLTLEVTGLPAELAVTGMIIAGIPRTVATSTVTVKAITLAKKSVSVSFDLCIENGTVTLPLPVVIPDSSHRTFLYHDFSDGRVMAAGWGNNGAGCLRNPGSTVVTRNGSATAYAITFTQATGYAGVWTMVPGADTSAYESVSFWIHGGVGGQNVGIQAQLADGSSRTLPLGQLLPGRWTPYSVTLADLGVTELSRLTAIRLVNQDLADSAQFHLDDLSFDAATQGVYAIYQDFGGGQVMRAGWGHNGLGSIRDVRSSPKVNANAITRNGSATAYSVSGNQVGAWAGVWTMAPGIDVSPYAAVTCWLHGGSDGGQRLEIQALYVDGRKVTRSIPAPRAGAWQKVTVYLDELGATVGKSLTSIRIGGLESVIQPAFVIDDLSLDEVIPAKSVGPG
jgi:arylsulfatase A-like enzyme